MNYYEHHLGDYLRDTAHLSILEDGVYRRLIDAYYIREAPLPADRKKCYKLARAQSKAEREAVDSVLEEFFDEEHDGFHHKRCDEELAKYLAKQPEIEEKKENDKERQRRARERRKALFHELSELGVNMPWNATTAELEAELSRVKSQPVTQPVTRDNTATHTPVPRHQTPVILDTSSELEISQGDDFIPPDWYSWFNQNHGTNFDPTSNLDRKTLHTVFTRWASAGITAAQVTQAIDRARKTAKGPIVNLPVYVDRVLISMDTERATPSKNQKLRAKNQEAVYRFLSQED